MALVNCKECTLDVSSEALRCPHCGIQVKKPAKGLVAGLFEFLFIVWNFLMLVWMILGISAVEKVPVLNKWKALTDLAQSGLDEYAILALWMVGSIILGFWVLVTRPKAS